MSININTFIIDLLERTDLKYNLNDYFGVGKYWNKTYYKVVTTDYDYLKWLEENANKKVKPHQLEIIRYLINLVDGERFRIF